MEREEENIRLRFQEKFDLRYVLKDGEYSLIRLGFFGFTTLILTAVITAIISVVIKAT